MRILLWSLAAEPVILAFIAYFLKQNGAGQPLDGDVIRTLLIVFAIVSLVMVYFSYAFVSGKFAPKPLPPAPPAEPVTRLVGIRITSIGLAAAPAILGFVLYLLSGDDWVLLAFNGGALAVAVRHVLAFNAADGKNYG